MPPSQMRPLGKLIVGTEVEAPREKGDDEYEKCTIKALDSLTGLLDVDFGDGFVRKAVPVAEIKFIEANLGPKLETTYSDAPLVPKKDPTAIPLEDFDPEEEKAYAAEMANLVPEVPTTDALAADEEAKYAYIKAYKDVGNGLFKAGKFKWAIKTYVAAVDAMELHCYKSRERMMWDYFARGPCGQCYSNAALCALKLGDATQAVKLCEKAMECRPEDSDLVKVLLRHGQALLALGEPEQLERAKELLEQAVGKEPNNRAVREELVKVKRAVKDAAKAADSRLFQSVDLRTKGLTSKKETVLEQLQGSLDEGFDLLLKHKDAEALAKLQPLLEGKAAEAKHRRPATMLAAYGVGVARYHARQQDEAIAAFGLYYEIKAELDGEGGDYTPPLMGLPLARFYYSHCLFEKQRLADSRTQLLAYFDEVAAAGPQKILNMPSGMMGRVITDAERGASRFKARASSKEAIADAHAMMAMIESRLQGGLAAIPHFEEILTIGATPQVAEAHENLAKTYEVLGREEHTPDAAEREAHLAKRDEHARLATEWHQKFQDEEAAAKRKKKEEAAKEVHYADPTADGEGDDDAAADAIPSMPEHDGDAAQTPDVSAEGDQPATTA